MKLRGAVGIVLLALVLTGCDKPSTHPAETAVSPFAAVTHLHALQAELTSAGVIPANHVFGTCTADDLTQLQAAVATDHWGRAASYLADVRADLASYAHTWPPGDKVSYRTVQRAVGRLLTDVPGSGADLHRACGESR